MNATEIDKLRDAVRQHASSTRQHRFCYRALCVLLIAEGHRPTQVADWLGEHTRTLERWRKRYTDNGLDGLIDDTSPGRPPKLSDDQWSQLREQLSNPPSTYGLEGKRWQGKLLQSHLSQQYGVEFSLRQCQRLLKQSRQNGAKPTAAKSPRQEMVAVESRFVGD